MAEFITPAQLQELSFITAEKLSLPSPTIIEKDYYVTFITQMLSQLENDFFQLVFTGGTCLAKAHKLIKRMSEDIDFKIVVKQSYQGSSKNHFLKELKKFRSDIISSIERLDLKVSLQQVQNEGQYVCLEVAYPSAHLPAEILRPHLLIELTYSPIYLPTKKLGLPTLIEEALQIPPLLPALSVECVDEQETAVEKWISLTRRIAAIERQYQADEPTLVRHIYDLNTIQQNGKITSTFFELSAIILHSESLKFKNQHPEYFDAPYDEIQKSLNLLKSNETWKQRYHFFIDAMVYEKISASTYEEALLKLIELDKNTQYLASKGITLPNISIVKYPTRAGIEKSKRF